MLGVGRSGQMATQSFSIWLNNQPSSSRKLLFGALNSRWQARYKMLAWVLRDCRLLQLAYSKKQETQQSTDKGSEEDQSLQALQMFHSWMRTSVFW